MVNYTLTVFLFLILLMLIAATVMSTIIAIDSKKAGGECAKKPHKYSTITAVITGVSILLVLIILIFYVYSKRGSIADDALNVASNTSTSALNALQNQISSLQNQIANMS